MPGFLFQRYLKPDAQVFLGRWLRGSFWMLLGTVVSGLSTGMASLVLARLFAPEVFGAFGMVKTTLDQLLVFAVMGIGLTTTRFTALHFKTNPGLTAEYWSSAAILISASGLFFALLLFISAPWLAVHWLHQPGLDGLLRTAALALFFISTLSALMGALQGLQAFATYGMLQLSQGLLAGGGLVIGGMFGGLSGAFAGYVTALGFQWVMAMGVFARVAMRHQIHWHTFSFTRLKEIISFAFPAALSSAVVAPVLWHLQAQTATQAGYAALGLYAGVFVFAQAIQLIQQSLGSALLPLLLSHRGERSRKQLFANYFGPWLAGMLLILPFLLFPGLAAWLLGGRYALQETPFLVPLLMITGLFHAAKGGVARDLVAANRMWLSVSSMVQWAVVSLLVFYLLGASAENLAISLFLGYGTNYLLSLPFFIAKKVVPKAVYYNRWLVLAWVGMMAVALLAVVSWPWFWRMGLQILWLSIVFWAVLRMWDAWLQEATEIN